MKIATKCGDNGTTSLMFGRRVSKSSARVRAYGAIDEFSSALASARALAKNTPLAEQILNIQKKLVFLMTELATAPQDYHLLKGKNIKLLDEADLQELETKIEEIEKSGNVFDGWKHAGNTPLDAALDFARVKCRAAEREIVALDELEKLPREFPLCYVNRLSDLLYLYSITVK